jgi:SAM-dependent methyltransferase
VVDAIFEEPRLAEIYDPLDPDRSDLDAYAALADEFSAGSVLDIGCGTGTLACLLATRGLEVIAVDPAAASLDVARRSPGADVVRWLHADATALPPLQVDLATMTGNVAQVFITDEEWAATLGAVREVLRPGGRLVFESRDPEKKAWLEWNRAQTCRRVVIPRVGHVETWTDLRDVEGKPGLLPDDFRVRPRRCGADFRLHVAVPKPRRTRELAGRGRSSRRRSPGRSRPARAWFVFLAGLGWGEDHRHTVAGTI